MVAIERFVIRQDKAASPSRSRAFDITTEGVIFALFICGLAWVPYWLGSNRLIAWGINAALFSGLAALYELSLFLRGALHPVPIKRIRVAAVLFAFVVVWIVLQNVTWMAATLQHPIWQLASDVLSWPVAGSISVDRDLTAIALLRLLTAASTFWLALQLSRDAKRARLLIWSVIGISACYAVVGLFALGFMPNGRLFAEFNAIKFVTSTFVNQNNYVDVCGHRVDRRGRSNPEALSSRIGPKWRFVAVQGCDPDRDDGEPGGASARSRGRYLGCASADRIERGDHFHRWSASSFCSS